MVFQFQQVNNPSKTEYSYMHILRSKITTKKVASQRQYTQSIKRMQHADKKKKEKEGLQATGKKMWSFYELWSREEANKKVDQTFV